MLHVFAISTGTSVQQFRLVHTANITSMSMRGRYQRPAPPGFALNRFISVDPCIQFGSGTGFGLASVEGGLLYGSRQL
jgi:hypothetical protein